MKNSLLFWGFHTDGNEDDCLWICVRVCCQTMLSNVKIIQHQWQLKEKVCITGGMMTGENETTQRNTYPIISYPSKIPCGLTWDWTQASAATGHHLTASTITQLFWIRCCIVWYKISIWMRSYCCHPQSKAEDGGAGSSKTQATIHQTTWPYIT